MTHLKCHVTGCDRGNQRPEGYTPECNKHYLMGVTRKAKDVQTAAKQKEETLMNALAQERADVARIRAELETKLQNPNRECLHGCGEPVKNHYRPGHDAKHVAWLREEIRLGLNTPLKALAEMPTPNMHNKMVGAIRKLGYTWDNDRQRFIAPKQEVTK